MFGSSFVMSVISVLLKTRTEKAIQQFYYVDHSHQD
jgi:hypothetical protein